MSVQKCLDFQFTPGVPSFTSRLACRVRGTFFADVFRGQVHADADIIKRRMPAVSEAALAYALSLAESSSERHLEDSKNRETPSNTPLSYEQVELSLIEQRFADLEQRLEQASPAKHVQSPFLLHAENSAVSEALASVQAQEQTRESVATTLAEAERAAKSSGGDATVFHLDSPETQPLPELFVRAVWPEMSVNVGPMPDQSAESKDSTVSDVLIHTDQGQMPWTLHAEENKGTTSAAAHAGETRHEEQQPRRGRTQEELRVMYERQKADRKSAPQRATQHDREPAVSYAVLSDFDFAGASVGQFPVSENAQVAAMPSISVRKKFLSIRMRLV